MEVGRNAVLQRSPIKSRHRYTTQVQILDAAQINCRHSIPLGITALAIRMNAAIWAETMLYHVFVKRVRRSIFFWSQQCQCVTRNKPQYRSSPLAHRTVACYGAANRAFHFKRHATTMTAAPIVHFYHLLLNCRYCRISASTKLASNISDSCQPT